MKSKSIRCSFKRAIQTGVAVCGFLTGTASAQTQTEFSWSGKGDGINWSDVKNWTEGVIPTGNGAAWRPPARIDVSGAEVTISQKVPRFFGDIKVGSAGKGCTLNLVAGGELTTQGAVLIGEKGAGNFNMTGGKLNIGVWGAKDFRIGNGVMTFGSAAADTAPVIRVDGAARGFTAGLNKGEAAEVTFSGYGTISTVQRAVFSQYGTAVINVTGGNLTLVFDTKVTGLNRIGGNHRSCKAVINYTLDSSGASTINFGGNVEFGIAEFHLNIDKSFSAKPGDVFTIVSATGDFTGQKGFSNVADGAEISAGGYTFKAAYTCDQNAKDTFTLTVVSGNTVG